MKEQVCQLFEVCQHEFANLRLPCEGRFTFIISQSATLKDTLAAKTSDVCPK